MKLFGVAPGPAFPYFEGHGSTLQAFASLSAEQGFALHPLDAQDITDIWQFMAEDNPPAARRVREAILSTLHRPVPFPQHGHRRPDLTSRPLRFILVREYLIAYAPEGLRGNI